MNAKLVNRGLGNPQGGINQGIFHLFDEPVWPGTRHRCDNYWINMNRFYLGATGFTRAIYQYQYHTSPKQRGMFVFVTNYNVYPGDANQGTRLCGHSILDRAIAVNSLLTIFKGLS